VGSAYGRTPRAPRSSAPNGAQDRASSNLRGLTTFGLEIGGFCD
jgi:hypothetical protein